MAVLKTSPTKKSGEEALNILSGSSACRVVKATETFAAGIITHFVSNDDATTITTVMSNDETPVNVVGSGSDQLNLTGATLAAGTVITPAYYENGRAFTSVTVGAGSIIVYYNEIISR